MDLQTLSKRTKLPLRKLRYVLDHRLLPGLRVRQMHDEVGQPRSFLDLEGFAIACAACLLEGGAKREAVIHFLDGLAGIRIRLGKHLPEQALVQAAFASAEPAVASLGDNSNIRLTVGKFDTGWLQPQTGAKLDDSYRPRVQVTIDLGRVRDQILDQ